VRADIEVAQGLRQQAGLRPNPTLTAPRRARGYRQLDQHRDSMAVGSFSS
jgi:hypothetical protein